MAKKKNRIKLNKEVEILLFFYNFLVGIGVRACILAFEKNIKIQDTISIIKIR